MKAERMKLVVEVPVPDGCSRTDVRDYVQGAIETMAQCREPPNEDNSYRGDPLFGAFLDTTRVWFWRRP